MYTYIAFEIVYNMNTLVQYCENDGGHLVHNKILYVWECNIVAGWQIHRWGIMENNHENHEFQYENTQCTFYAL